MHAPSLSLPRKRGRGRTEFVGWNCQMSEIKTTDDSDTGDLAQIRAAVRVPMREIPRRVLA